MILEEFLLLKGVLLQFYDNWHNHWHMDGTSFDQWVGDHGISLAGSFIWDDTEEGYQFWWDLEEEYQTFKDTEYCVTCGRYN